MPLDGPSVGPFATPEEAGIAAVDGLGLRDGPWVEMLLLFATMGTDIGRAAAAMLVRLEPREAKTSAAARSFAAQLLELGHARF